MCMYIHIYADSTHAVSVTLKNTRLKRNAAHRVHAKHIIKRDTAPSVK